MKFEFTLDRLEEMALCIVINQLSEEEACQYVLSMAEECSDIETVGGL